MARLPGVKGAACSSNPPQTGGGGVGPVQYNGSERLVLGETAVDFGFFELFGIELAAGTVFFGGLRRRQDAGGSRLDDAPVDHAERGGRRGSSG